jgi:hypothetical protein
LLSRGSRGFWSNRQVQNTKIFKFTSCGRSSCFGLNFSPFGIKHQNGELSGLKPHCLTKKLQINIKSNEKTQGRLGTRYIDTIMQWKPFSLSKSTFSLSMHLWDYININSTNILVSKDQVVVYPPPKHVHHLHKYLWGPGMTFYNLST